MHIFFNFCLFASRLCPLFMNKDHILLGILWILYCILHSMLASSIVKNFAQERFGFSAISYRLFYNLFAFIGLGALIFHHASVASYFIFHRTLLNQAIAILLSIAGLIIMVICIIKYFRQMAGISAIKKDQVLQVTGLHRYVRHPLYLGTFIFLIGLACLFPLLKNATAVSVIIIYTIIGIRFEEMKLIKQFGEDYIAYQRKVPMLIPFIK